jgi:hypothetical protein
MSPIGCPRVHHGFLLQTTSIWRDNLASLEQGQFLAWFNNHNYCSAMGGQAIGNWTSLPL